MKNVQKTLIILPAVLAVLPDFDDISESITTLHEIAGEHLNMKVIDDADEAISALSTEERSQFDHLMISISGWTMDTLKKLAEGQGREWLDQLKVEMNSDDCDPFRETGKMMVYWVNLNPDVKVKLDPIFALIFTQSMTEMLSSIHDEISEALEAQAA
jgi:hypothetical protein